MILFIALFRMASFIMLPQFSPLTFFILDIFHCNFESIIIHGVRTIATAGRLNRKFTSIAYQATEDFITSFVPWLILASVLSILAIACRLCNLASFWFTFLSKLWLLDSEQRSILQIFADPTRRHYLAKHKPCYKKNWRGKLMRVDPGPLAGKHLEEHEAFLDKHGGKERDTYLNPL